MTITTTNWRDSALYCGVREVRMLIGLIVMRRHSLARQGSRTSSKKSLVHLLLGHHQQLTATLSSERASTHQAFSVRLFYYPSTLCSFFNTLIDAAASCTLHTHHVRRTTKVSDTRAESLDGRHFFFCPSSIVFQSHKCAADTLVPNCQRHSSRLPP